MTEMTPAPLTKPEPSLADDLRAMRFQDESGRIIVSWRLIRTVLTVSAATFVASLLFGGSRGMLAMMPSLTTLVPYASLRRSTPRHRVLIVAAFVLTFLTLTVPALLHLDGRSHWWPYYPVTAGLVLVVLVGYIALSQLPGWSPPLADTTPEPPSRFVPSRRWTADERRALLPESGRLTFRRRYVQIVYVAIFVLLAGGAVALAIAVFTVGDPVRSGNWFGGVFCVVAAISAVVVAIRARRIALEVDADGVTARNLFTTGHLRWDDVQWIRSPEGDWFGRIRFRGPRFTGFSSPVFGATLLPRRKQLRSDLDLINSMFGPADQTGTPPVDNP
jgi:PH (Pleckstrin Homology) domain-containing protein